MADDRNRLCFAAALQETLNSGKQQRRRCTVSSCMWKGKTTTEDQSTSRRGGGEGGERTVADCCDQARDRELDVVGILVVHALRLHEPAQRPRVCGQSRDGDAHMIVNLERLFVVRRQLRRRSLRHTQPKSETDLENLSETSEDSTVHTHRAMGAQSVRNINGSKQTLSDASTACVLLLIPTPADPCFTASIAYSSWCNRPCVVDGLSTHSAQ